MSKGRVIDAVESLDAPAVRSLIDSRPELLHATNPRGFGLLHLACAASCPRLGLPESAAVRLVDLLLDRGLDIEAPVGKDKCTVLFFAVARGRNLAVTRRLIARGADVRQAPGGGLFAAGWWEDLKILDVLIAAGADIEQVAGVTPFLACWAWGRFDAARRLAKRGANINTQDQKGRTALHIGLEKDFDPARLAWLVKQGASIDLPDRRGVTARAKAARKRDPRYRAAIA